MPVLVNKRECLAARRLMAVLLLAILPCAFLSSCGGLFGEAMDQILSDDRYVYPLDPFSDPVGWAKYTPEETVELNRVPPGVLARMSTKGLVWTVIDHPSFGMCSAFNTVEGAVETLRYSANAVDVLLSRNDARYQLGEAMAELLRTVDQLEPADTNTDRYTPPDIWCLEALLLYLDDPGCAKRAIPGLGYKWTVGGFMRCDP